MKNKLITDLRKNLFYLIAKLFWLYGIYLIKSKLFISVNNRDFFQHKVNELIIESLNYEDRIIKLKKKNNPLSKESICQQLETYNVVYSDVSQLNSN